jgi:hypothetical protein
VIHVTTVDLAAKGVRLPSDRVSMVIAQPHVPISSLSVDEPFQWTAAARAGQLAVLTETLSVARSTLHGVAATHFTVFPEYSVPGLEGVALIEAELTRADWPNGTVVIGGTDGLSQQQYATLLQGNATHVDARNAAGQVPADKWVNCAITWVKDSQGTVERWVQLKLHPAREEMDISHQHMFRGTSVYVFKGLLHNQQPYRFGTLICFDWIATVGDQTPCQWILADLQQQAENIQVQLPISWFFVIQRNKRPSHDTFLNGVGTFFNQIQFPNAPRERACLVFANTAGKEHPGRVAEFGGCSLILSPQSLFKEPASAPTFARGGPRFRDGSNLLLNYKDVFFRERGACIHSFAQINPGSLNAGPAGIAYPVDNAHVCPVSGAAEPRAPRAAVPAAVKWLNDELDGIPSLSVQYSEAAVGADADLAHAHNITALRQLSSQAATNAIRLASPDSTIRRDTESVLKPEDEWDSLEAQALTHLLHTLDILGIGFQVTAGGAETAHATIVIDDRMVDVLAVRGFSHEACITHSKSFLTNQRRQVLLVSRDPDNTVWERRFASFLDPEVAKPGEERKITEPGSGSLHLGYQNVLTIFRTSPTTAAVLGGINAVLAA